MPLPQISAPTSTLVLGAVAYDAKVVPIWEGFAAHFAQQGLPFAFVLYSNYERQVEALLAGHVHVAWSSPLAWLEAERAARAQGRVARAVAMRDTDRDLVSVIVAHRASGPRSLADLRGGRIAVGAADSPQATLIPLLAVAEAGVEPGRDVEVVRHDLMLGKHGDHVGGEREAVRALLEGRVEAACLLDGNLLQFAREGLLPSDAIAILARVGPYDHCNFTVLDPLPTPAHRALLERFVSVLLEMSYADPSVRQLMDMEGLKAWHPGRVTGYALLARALDRFGTIDPWLRGVTGT